MLDFFYSFDVSVNLNPVIFFVNSYHSFDRPRNSEEKDTLSENVIKCARRPSHRPSALHYYNTLSDPLNPWFHDNGLPASKALHDDRLASYCRSMDAKDSNKGIISYIAYRRSEIFLSLQMA